MTSMLLKSELKVSTEAFDLTKVGVHKKFKLKMD
jgi:hypothetical protein